MFERNSTIFEGVMEENRQVFEADEDAYGGMNVHIKDSMDSIKFIAMLRASITQWTNQVFLRPKKNNLV